MALVIPIETRGGRGPVILLVILDRENWNRMQQADPFDLQAVSLGPVMRGEKLEDLDLVIAYEENAERLVELAKAGKLQELIAHVERGRRHRPEEGDTTRPVSIKRPGRN